MYVGSQAGRAKLAPHKIGMEVLSPGESLLALGHEPWLVAKAQGPAKSQGFLLAHSQFSAGEGFIC